MAAYRVAEKLGGCSLNELKSAIQSEAEQIRADLCDEGLMMSSWLYACAAWLPFFSCLGLLLVSFLKMNVGLQLGKPIEFLVLSSIVLGIFTWLFVRLCPADQSWTRLVA